MTTRIEKIVLSKTQTAFIGRENCNGVGVVSGSVEDIAGLFSKHSYRGCKIVFSTSNAPNFKRCFNANVKRANAIAMAAGVSLSSPADYVIDGFVQSDKFVMEVL